MMPSLLGLFTILVRLAFAVPVLVLLLNLFSRTRMSSFLWLSASLVGWPLIAYGTSLLMPVSLKGYGTAMQPKVTLLTSIYLVESVIGGALLLVSVLRLSRDLNARMLPETPKSS